MKIVYYHLLQNYSHFIIIYYSLKVSYVCPIYLYNVNHHHLHSSSPISKHLTPCKTNYNTPYQQKLLSLRFWFGCGPYRSQKTIYSSPYVSCWQWQEGKDPLLGAFCPMHGSDLGDIIRYQKKQQPHQGNHKEDSHSFCLPKALSFDRKKILRKTKPWNSLQWPTGDSRAIRTDFWQLFPDCS